MSPIRVAIVGLGKIARDQHIPAIAGTSGIELTAIVSRNASRASFSRKERGSVGLRGPAPP